MKTDLEIQKDVMEQLRWQPILDAAPKSAFPSKTG